MKPTGMVCGQCGKKDDKVNLEANLVKDHWGEWYVLLQCEKCLKHPKIEQKYNYRIPVYCPKNKKLTVIVKVKRPVNKMENQS